MKDDEVVWAVLDAGEQVSLHRSRQDAERTRDKSVARKVRDDPENVDRIVRAFDVDWVAIRRDSQAVRDRWFARMAGLWLSLLILALVVPIHLSRAIAPDDRDFVVDRFSISCAITAALLGIVSILLNDLAADRAHRWAAAIAQYCEGFAVSLTFASLIVLASRSVWPSIIVALLIIGAAVFTLIWTVAALRATGLFRRTSPLRSD